MACCEFELLVHNFGRVTLPWLRGCVVSNCAPARTMVVLALRVLAEPTVVPVRRAIPSGYICARRVLAELKVVCV